MHTDRPTLALDDVVYVIVPRLNRAQKLVNQTLDTLIRDAASSAELAKRLEQRRCFTLELQAINTNLEHLLARHRADVQTLLQSGGSKGGRHVALDPMETDAVERAKEIYRKVVAFQTGRREVPF
ncbi:hypothetical protein GCM10022228_20660 [Halomonas cibimaris]|uniref:Uncharacterized protein n=1 Tax=Halomonas cibimaris TaxID=657012 RepID=A0ABP7LW87_9GAMM